MKQKTTTNIARINVNETNISIIKINDIDYISAADIAKHKTNDLSSCIANWMRNRINIESLGI